MLNYKDSSLTKLKKKFRTGDIFFIKSKTGVFDKLVRFFSKSNFIHTAILLEIRGLWFVIETRYTFSCYGYQLVPIDWWFARHVDDSIYLGKMPRTNSNSEYEHLLRRTLLDTSESLRPYKLTWVFLTYVLQVWCGFFRPNISWFYKGPKPLICSTLIQEAWEKVGVIERSNYMTPADLVNAIGGVDNLIPLQDDEDQHSYEHIGQKSATNLNTANLDLATGN